MKTVVCVYWKGVFRGRERVYSPEWVYRLKRMVTKHMPYDEAFRFVCMTNVPEEFDDTMETIPLIRNWPGWWSKLEIFRNRLFDDHVLYLDLDLLVLDDLSPFFESKVPFKIMKSPMGKSVVDKITGGMAFNKYNSSVMSFTPHAQLTFSLFSDFDYEKASKEFRGDQDWIGERLGNVPTFDENWIKKLRDCPNGEPLPGQKIMLCMAGGKAPLKNITASEKYPWVKELWQ